MTSPLVATKLFVPRLRRGLVDRARLTSQLGTREGSKLTLVSAPAGFGKTTVVTAWLTEPINADRAIAWVSLDEEDEAAPSFWIYVIAGLQSVRPEVGASLLPLLRAGQPPAPQLLASLINEIADQDLDIDLVLDDYQLVDGPAVAEGMTYLIDHLPPNLHVVLITRADPDLPLARLRARGELVEVRASDLRFTEPETATYLQQVADLTLDQQDVTALTDRTEGWAAALQLASLSMRGREDISGFVAGFAGEDRYVVDYLVDEVLSRQSDQVRAFLLRTSVLDRLTGDLCDTVTGEPGGRAMLEALDRANLFLVPLDNRRTWYRYHHLFADVLRVHLDAEHPDLAGTLHRRASDWFAAAGETAAAVRHALAVPDTERAADLVEAAVPALGRERAEATLRAWVDDFPDDVIRRRPVLALGLVGGLMQANEFDPAEAMLAEVERWLPAIRDRLSLASAADDPTPADDAPAAADLVFLDEGALARVPASVEMYRAALALVHGDPAATLRYAESTLALAVPGDHLAHGAAMALSGLACWTGGELETAHGWYAQAVDDLVAAGHLTDVLGCVVAVADLSIAQGHLDEARRAYDEGLELAGTEAGPRRGVADMHTGIAEIAVERGELDLARRHLLLCQQLGEALGLGQNPYRVRATSAALAEAEGDLVTARELLVEAVRVYLGDFSPDVRPLPARIARIDLAHGDLDSALRWAESRELSAAQDLSYLREYEHVTLAETLLAQHRLTGDTDALKRSAELLARLLVVAESAARTATVLEVLVLQAMAATANADNEAAARSLRHALELAEPEGQVRVFARHGALMAAMLDTVDESHGLTPHAERVRAAILHQDAEAGGVVAGTPTPRHEPRLVDPLSPRELEVLRLLASDLDGPGIARHLVISLNTLRTHTKNIYAKLGVTSRRAALRRAQELGLPLHG